MNKLTDQELGHLELLLEKFSAHLGHTYCIVYPVIQDGFSIAIYDSNGDLLKKSAGYSLQNAIEELNKSESLKNK